MQLQVSAVLLLPDLALVCHAVSPSTNRPLLKSAGGTVEPFLGLGDGKAVLRVACHCSQYPNKASHMQLCQRPQLLPCKVSCGAASNPSANDSNFEGIGVWQSGSLQTQ